MPLIWGAELTAPIAVRWKGQFNENAKIPAYASALPELDHNEICGFAGMPAELGSRAALLMLREPAPAPPGGAALRPHPRAGRAARQPGRSRSRPTATAPLARMLDLVLLGDYVSLYLALLRGVDPGPVEMIERLKARLAETGYGRAAAPSS